MEEFAQSLACELSEIYKNIIKLEEKALDDGNLGLTLSEVHLLNLLFKYKSDGITVSEIAREMNVTKPTVTVAVNRMVKKVLAEKQIGDSDLRTVRVKITKEGINKITAHRRSQKKVIKGIEGGLTVEQREVLLQAIRRLNLYINKEDGKS